MFVLQNAGVLSHARHLLRAATTNAKNYYQLSFFEEGVRQEEHDGDRQGEGCLKEREMSTGETTAASVKDEARKKNLVDLLIEQEAITDI